MSMGEFELYCGGVGKGISDLVEALLGVSRGHVTESVSGAGEIRIHSDSISLRVFDYSNEMGGLSFLGETPWGVSISLRGGGGEWADSRELAYFLYDALLDQGGFRLLLVHDEEEFVRSNFQDPSFSQMAVFKYWPVGD